MPDICPRCKEDVILVDPSEEEWGLEGYDEDVEVWLCTICNWNEEADEAEALEYHVANLEWAMQRLAGEQ